MGGSTLLLPNIATSIPPPGQGSVVSRPELLQVQTGSSILVQCHYRLQDVKAQKVWCRFSAASCQPLVTSAVDRRGPGGGRTFLTDLGGGLLQVEMVSLQEEDAGEYGCMVEGAAGPQTLHRISLVVLPQGEWSMACFLPPCNFASPPTSVARGSWVPDGWRPFGVALGGNILVTALQGAETKLIGKWEINQRKSLPCSSHSGLPIPPTKVPPFWSAFPIPLRVFGLFVF